MSRPLILLDPYPRTEEMIWTEATKTRMEQLGDVACHFGSRMPDDRVDSLLPRVSLIIGQTAMDRDRLERAPALRGIINVKANWEPNVDYAHAQSRGIHVLSTAPAMAPAVAEFCLGQAIALTRGLTSADRKFRASEESYGIAGGRRHRSLFGACFGLIGFGNLGRALLPLLQPFGGRVLVHDPWLSDGYLSAQGLEPLPLDDVLARAQVLFVLAGSTTVNQGFLDATALARIADDSAVVLASRAEVVDFAALLSEGASGRLRVAIDVYPEEPVPALSAMRGLPNILFTSHLAGAIPASYARMRDAVLDDAAQILAGKPPMRLQPAVPQLASISNSR